MNIGRQGVKFAVVVANRFNPVTADPAAPLRTTAMVDAFGPSLMPRSSLHQGMAAGLSVITANLVGRAIDVAIRRVVPASSSYLVRFGARAVVSCAGLALARIPESDSEATYVSSARTAGSLVMAGGVGGMIYESGTELRTRYPAGGSLRPIAIGLGAFAGALVYSDQLLHKRQGIIKRWSEDDKPASLPGSIAIGAGVVGVGQIVGRGYLASRTYSQGYFGGDPLRDLIGRSINTSLWVGGAIGLYFASVGLAARSNERIEPAYRTPPESDFVSGGPRSGSPFDELGLQGRRYVTDVVTPDLIEAALGEPAAAHPIRAYVGYNSEPLYATGRSEMALDELARLGAFDRKYLLLVAPTGTGWVDQTMIESAEILSRGDIATCCIQYGRTPSFLAMQKVALGRQQFRQLLWGVNQRLADRPREKRPTVLVFGESLGAWSSSDVVMHRGIKGFDHYGIDRALWFGLPGLAKWSKNGMRDGSSSLVPEGAVGAFDRFDQYDELTSEQKEAMRAVIVDHDNDPIAQLSIRLAVKAPVWLRSAERGRNVPEQMQWTPLLTFVQVLIDAMNAMRVIPGEFKTFGHDYRGDTAAFVEGAYQFPPVSSEQLVNVHDALIDLELERAERMMQTHEPEGPGGETCPKRTKGPKYLRYRRPRDDGAISAAPCADEGDCQ